MSLGDMNPGCCACGSATAGTIKTYSHCDDAGTTDGRDVLTTSTLAIFVSGTTTRVFFQTGAQQFTPTLADGTYDFAVTNSGLTQTITLAIAAPWGPLSLVVHRTGNPMCACACAVPTSLNMAVDPATCTRSDIVSTTLTLGPLPSDLAGFFSRHPGGTPGPDSRAWYGTGPAGWNVFEPAFPRYYQLSCNGTNYGLSEVAFNNQPTPQAVMAPIASWSIDGGSNTCAPFSLNHSSSGTINCSASNSVVITG